MIYKFIFTFHERLVIYSPYILLIMFILGREDKVFSFHVMDKVVFLDNKLMIRSCCFYDIKNNDIQNDIKNNSIIAK